MEYQRQLAHKEELCRSLVAAWHDLAANGDDRAAVHERIARELAETQMLLERHLAELPHGERATERYRLEFELPTFSYLKRWYHLFVPELAP